MYVLSLIHISKDLDIIAADDYSRLMRNMQKQGIRKIEPLDDELVTAEPSLLRQAIKILFDQKVFTPNEFLEELSREYGLTLYPKAVSYTHLDVYKRQKKRRSGRIIISDRNGTEM